MTINDFMIFLKCAIGDATSFAAFQAIFVTLFLYAFVKDRGWFKRKSGLTATVKRGKESWANFHLMYGLLAVVFAEVINTTETLKGFKTIITLADLSVLFYLCFFNGWFRNKIMGIIIASQNMEEPNV
ncbi:hypothetical protein [Methylobacter sp.]|uniref:hypothetical protein n=1 Tax=Methylobacter sp. TaxID=2051955 RepID=UPI00120F18BF|nr:hypothetical protein [Methylobacter sp.]TAK62768.1 MAG: hypothetical protein EPO18_09345 [Methylobacter sp.]